MNKKLTILVNLLVPTKGDGKEVFSMRLRRFAGKFFLILSISAGLWALGYQPVLGQVVCNQDGNIHVPPSYKTFLPPAKGFTYLDQTYCNTIKRLSDSTNPGPGRADFTMAEYATQNHFNADETKIVVSFFGLDNAGFRKANAQVLDLNGNLVCDVPTISINNEPMWDRTDPNIFYFHAANEVRRANVSTCPVDSLPLRTFTEYTSIHSTGESDLSPDGNHIVFVGVIGGVPTDVFVYTISTNVKGPFLSVVGSSLDWAHVTNNFVVLGFPNFLGLGQRVRVYDHNMIFQRELANYIGHEDVGIDSTGNEVLYLVNAGDTDPQNVNCVNSVVKFRLADGARTCLKTGAPAFDWSLATHVSAPEQQASWVYVTTYAPSDPDPDLGQWKAYTNELLRIRDDGSGILERLAHHYSRPFGTNTYNWTPRASVNKDGMKVLFNSTYGLHYKSDPLLCNCKVDEQYTDTYFLSLFQ